MNGLAEASDGLQTVCSAKPMSQTGRVGEFVAVRSGHWLGSDGAGQCRRRLRRQHLAKPPFGPASAVKLNAGLMAITVSTTARSNRLLPLPSRPPQFEGRLKTACSR